MKQALRYFLFLTLIAFLTIGFGGTPRWLTILGSPESPVTLYSDTTIPDTTIKKVTLPFPFRDESYDPSDPGKNGGLYLNNPSNIQEEVVYDPKTNSYVFKQKVGGLDYRRPSYMTFDEYVEYDMEKSMRKYWASKHEAQNLNKATSLIPKIHVGGEVFDRIFGGNTVDIRPQGSAELIFGVNSSNNKNPALAEKQRKITTFDFNQKIQLNVIGKIGDKLKLTTNYNTEATFDFENQMKLEYTGYEDEIIKKIEAGNVSLPLTGSLITGSQSLFGIKTQLQFGRLTVTTVLSQQKGNKKEVNVQGGAQTTNFEIRADNYEANRHFFLSEYFLENYDRAHDKPPIILSDVTINRVEVWVVNRNSSSISDLRHVVALERLGEDLNAATAPFPKNENDPVFNPQAISAAGGRDRNSLTQYLRSQGLTSGRDFEKIENARRLTTTEYTVNTKLGYISLNNTLNPDDMLAVAFQYTNTVDGQTYQVGEFSTDGIEAPNSLIVKLLKPARVNVRGLTWRLMMKNVYSIGGYQISDKEFRLDVFHSNFLNGADVRYIPEGAIKGQLLLQVVKLDRVNPQQAPRADGVFDFLHGITINKENGRIFFPVVEPFGEYLHGRIRGNDPNNGLIANKYAFTELYDSTKTAASLLLNKNRFKLKGSYQSSSSSEIQLNAVNIPQGSVTVSAGGAQLVENQDYTVDYQLGRVKIINQGVLASNTPIKVNLETQQTFGLQVRNLIGSRFDYKVNNDFSLGGTVMNLTEKPITQKVNLGDEPISNTIWGLDANYRTEAPIITRWIDKLPLLSTKIPSSVTAVGEFAQLIPGHSKAIGKDGNAYIDDYEGSYTALDIRSVNAWQLSSVPQGQPDLFPEMAEDTSSLKGNLRSGFNRARLSWYVIDPLFYRDNSLTPAHITGSDQQTNNYTREVLETEIFPKKELATGTPPTLPVLNLSYFPFEKGPYNYDTSAGPFSAGLGAGGYLNNPETRWAGMMRKLETTDFEASNVEYVQFWLMDPFDPDNGNPNHTGGDIYLNLGDISEDILKDDLKAFEHGLPTTDKPYTASTETDTVSVWGRVPLTDPIVNAFNTSEESRKFQDVGLDGFGDNNESSFFTTYRNWILNNVTDPEQRDSLSTDVSQDNFSYYRGSKFDEAETGIINRYKYYSNLEGNSSVEQPEGFPQSSTTLPNVEDINRDNTLVTQEAYYQYRVHLEPNQMNIGENFITDIVTGSTTINNKTVSVKWYQFKVPVRTPDRVVGEISDFRSIRFMRIFLKNFQHQTTLRFGRLDLIRGEWRKYDYDLRFPGEYITDDNFNNTLFNLSAVNVEENSSRSPINYVIPPGIVRERNVATTNLALQNEQSLSLRVCNLQDGHSRAIFRNVDLDVRQYKRLKMYVHAEASQVEELKDKDLVLFLRLGKDLDQNYYEYEIPLYVTNWKATNPEEIWPLANQINIEFEKLKDAKLLRNTHLSDGLATLELPYMVATDSSTIYVKGNPNIGDLKTVMIGIRNPKRNTVEDSDDGLPKCAEVWVNELRLTEFDEQGGWAVNGRVTAKLADLGTVTVSGTKKTPGFGSIEQKLNERSREDFNSYDISSGLELGKFIPEKAGIKIPVFLNFSQTFINPQYDPLDKDIEFKELREALSPEDFDERKRLIRDYTLRKGINFTNVKKEKTGANKKSHIYDIENIALTFAYNEQKRENINTIFNNTRNYKAAVAYNFSTNPKNVKPFNKVKLLNKEYFKIIKDFNFNTAPSRIAFRTDIDRNYNEAQTRNVVEGFVDSLPATFTKTFDIVRVYDFKYDLSKSLNFDFSATNRATIDELPGSMHKDSAGRDERRDEIIRQLKNFGRNMDYRHVANINYNIPINKIPIFNFITATAKYTANYNWIGAALGLDTLGHTIQNSNTKQLTGNLNMVQLYNRIPYYKKMNQPKGKSNKPSPKPAAGAAVPDSLKKKEVNIPILEYVTRMILSLKRVNLSYSENNGSVLPGYNRTTRIIGMDQNFEGPGWGFLAGDVRPFGDNDFGEYAAQRGWLRTSNSLNTPFTVTRSINTTGRATFEPVKDLEVELNVSRTLTENNSKYLRYIPDSGFVSRSPQQSGNFSISFLTWRTAFIGDRTEGEIDDFSEVFQNFINYREVMSRRLGEEYTSSTQETLTDSAGYKIGYGRNSQDVLLYSFLAAYSGTNPEQFDIKGGETRGDRRMFIKIPKPNWSIKYDGLSKIPALQKYFKSVTVSHRYRSTFNIGSYTNNLQFNEFGETGFAEVNNRDVSGNLINHFQVATATITEQFAPLINIDMSWTNKLITKLELKRDRTISLAFSNSQITETKGREIVIGAGYRFSNVSIPLPGASKKKLTSDLNVRSDVSFRYNNTITRRINEVTQTQQNQVTGGQNVISIKNSADYVVNERVNVRLFFDKIITKPQTSQSFETANTNAGISIRFTLQ